MKKINDGINSISIVNIFQCVDTTTIKVYLRTSPGISSSFVFTFVFSVASAIPVIRRPNTRIVGKPKRRKLDFMRKMNSFSLNTQFMNTILLCVKNFTYLTIVKTLTEKIIWIK